MRIDSHQHFWQYDPIEFGWISPDMPGLQRDLLPADLAPFLAAHQLDGCVAVQARSSLAESDWLLSLASQSPFIKGVVGWVDLLSPAVEADLERLAANPRFRGLRHIVQSEPDDAFMLRPEFQRGIRSLAHFGLVYDILIFPRHLPAAFSLASAFPNQVFVLDHIAKPYVKDRLISPWDTGIRTLASLPNVYCKVSGLVTEADWSTWQPADFRPYLDVVFEAFGANRIMFGSDWPVCTLAGTYSQVYNLLDGYANSLSPTEQSAIWGGTAVRAYGLTD